MIPVRFVVATYNIWASERWPDREPALRGFLQDIKPDIIALQELRQATRDVLDEELQGYGRVHNDFEGWVREGNIYWSSALFEEVEHGAEDVGILEPLRRLFWVRLKLKGTDQTLLVSTAHYTWVGHKREATEGLSPRMAQAQATVASLDRLAAPDEPVIFMGDLNESGNAIRALRQGGLKDSWSARGVNPVPTHPAAPTAKGSPSVLDWQFHRGPIRAISTEVVDYYKGDLAPSGHKPVVVTYGWDLT